MALHARRVFQQRGVADPKPSGTECHPAPNCRPRRSEGTPTQCAPAWPPVAPRPRAPGAETGRSTRISPARSKRSTNGTVPPCRKAADGPSSIRCIPPGVRRAVPPAGRTRPSATRRMRTIPASSSVSCNSAARVSGLVAKMRRSGSVPGFHRFRYATATGGSAWKTSCIVVVKQRANLAISRGKQHPIVSTLVHAINRCLGRRIWGVESWLGKFERGDKWNCWPTASKIAVEQERR